MSSCAAGSSTSIRSEAAAGERVERGEWLGCALAASF
jgi:hypothetical protein